MESKRLSSAFATPTHPIVIRTKRTHDPTQPNKKIKQTDWFRVLSCQEGEGGTPLYVTNPKSDMEPDDTRREDSDTDSQLVLHPPPPLSFPTKRQLKTDATRFQNCGVSYCAERQGSFMRDQAFIDRTPQLEKLRLDIATATAAAEQHGIGLQDIIVTLLQRGEDLCQLGAERGLDLARIGEFFKGDGE
jgi:hypothetical protein